MLRFYEEFHRLREGLDGCIINDPLAVALAIFPALGTARAMHVTITRTDDLTRGQSICDRRGLLGQPANAAVYLTASWADVLRLVNSRVFADAIPERELLRGLVEE